MEGAPQISWQSLEYAHKPKKHDWFWAVAIIGACLGAVAIIMDNFLFGVFIILSSLILIALKLRHPRAIHYSVSENEIVINSNVIPLKKIKEFSIKNERGNKKLILEVNRPFMPYEVIIIEDDLEYSITKILEPRVKMNEELEEPFIYKLLDKFDI